MLVRISQLPPVPYVRVSFMCQMQGLSALRPGHLASGTFTRLRLLANLTSTILASCVFISMIEHRITRLAYIGYQDALLQTNSLVK